MTRRRRVPDVRGFTWIAGATVAHLSEPMRLGAGTPDRPWQYGHQSICHRHLWTPYQDGPDPLVFWSGREVPDGVPWCTDCRLLIASRTLGYRAAGLLDGLQL